MPSVRTVAKDVALLRDFNRYMSKGVEIDSVDLLVASGSVTHAIDELNDIQEELKKFRKQFLRD